LAQQPGGLTDLEFNNTPFISKRDRNWFAVDWNLWAINLNHEFSSKTKWNTKVFGLDASRKTVGFLGQINRVDPLEERNLIVGEFNNFGMESRLLHIYEIKEKPQALLIGIRLYKGYSINKQGFANKTTHANFNFIENDNLQYSNYEFPSFNGAFFIENIFRVGEKTNIIPGVRAEYINTNAEGNYNEVVYDLAGNAIFDTIRNESLSNVRNFIIAGIGITHNVKGDSLELYANFSQNYRSINFTDMQIVNPNLRIDPNLEDERGFNSDIGVKGLLGKSIYYDISAFALFYHNRIGTTIMKASLLFNTFQYRTNIAKSLTIGFEGLVQVDWMRLFNSKRKEISFGTFLNYSYTNAKYLSENSLFNGNHVELVPPVNYKIGADFGVKNFSLGYQFTWMHWQYSDASNSLSQANAVNGIIPTYMIMDISLKYKFDLLTLSTGVNNLTNEIYFTRRATSYPGPGIITASPRSFYLTLGIDF
jgi:Fe(3+) dicitrate transport protein